LPRFQRFIPIRFWKFRHPSITSAHTWTYFFSLTHFTPLTSIFLHPPFPSSTFINMKLLTAILPLAAITNAFILPDDQVMEQIAIEKKPQSYFDQVKGSVEDVWSGVEHTFKDAVAFGENAFDNAINAATEVSKDAAAKFECPHSMMAFDTQAWLDSAVDTVEDLDLDDVFDHPHKKPHKKPKHPHHPPHGRHPHHKPNLTVYQLIAGSKYTTKLAKLINEFPDLVEVLNGTLANYTVFAPTDKAFEKIPKHGQKPSKELIHKVLAYHVSPHFYPAGRVLISHTIPTALGEDALGGEAQRLRVSVGLGGLRLNFFSKVVAVNIVRTSPSLLRTLLRHLLIHIYPVRHKRRNPRRRFSPPPTATRIKDPRAPSWRILNPRFRSQQNRPRQDPRRCPAHRRHTLRSFQLGIQEAGPQDQRFPLQLLRREIPYCPSEIPRCCQPDIIL
jgi:uncharacterized surface protein with fasciclin (FAS1) repeats